MSDRIFREMIEDQWSRDHFVCVGLDSELKKIPQSAHRSENERGNSVSNTIVAFNIGIIEATKDLVCAYKPNVAFYEAQGAAGLNALHRTIENIHILAPKVPVILDAKRADIGNTNAGYVTWAFDFLQADAITIHPYLGAEALEPFLERKDKGIFVLCRTSNPGAGEFQDLQVQMGPILVGNEPMFRPIYQIVAARVARHWNKNENCALVVGATYPHELYDVRSLVGDIPILIPGIGAQGGDLEATVKAGKDSRDKGMIINSSRGIIFASSGEDYPDAARRETAKLNRAIEKTLDKAVGQPN